MREILRSLPDEDAPASRRVDAGDRRAVAAHIAARLRAERG